MHSKIAFTLVSALSLLSSSTALSNGADNELQARADPNDIMMFVCNDYKGRTLKDLCQGMCFGSYCAGNGMSLVWDKPSASVARGRARAAGCRPTPNRCAKSPYGKNYECDEFPFKSVEDVKGGTRVNRCVPKQQNSDQAQIIKAFYANKDYCNGKPPCKFNTGYENSGNIKYCDMKTCKNDGNEYTKGGKFNSRDTNFGIIDEMFVSPNVSSITYPTLFKTAMGTEVSVAQGAKVGDIAHRMTINDIDLWDKYIKKVMAEEEAMTEDEYWNAQVAPASDELMSLISFEKTTITEVVA